MADVTTLEVAVAVGNHPGIYSIDLAGLLRTNWNQLRPIMTVAELNGLVWCAQENPDASKSAWRWYPPSTLGHEHRRRMKHALDQCERGVVQFFSKDTDIPCLAGDPVHKHFSTFKEYRNGMHSITVYGTCDRCALDTRCTVRI